MKNLPLIIAIAGGGLIFYLWKQKQAAAAIPPPGSYQVTAQSVPQEWIESTPEGVSVGGTTNELYDILT